MDDQEFLRNEIYNSMNARETDELVDIWQEHDSSQWTDLAFEVVKEILWKRLGTLPPQENAFEKTTLADEENAIKKVVDQTGQVENRRAVSQPCPNCRGDQLFTGKLVILNSDSLIALKTVPLLNSDNNEEDEVGYSEIVALACNDCGHVFFMLKEYV